MSYSYNPVTGLGSIGYVYTLNDNTLNTIGAARWISRLS